MGAAILSAPTAHAQDQLQQNQQDITTELTSDIKIVDIKASDIKTSGADSNLNLNLPSRAYNLQSFIGAEILNSEILGPEIITQDNDVNLSGFSDNFPNTALSNAQFSNNITANRILNDTLFRADSDVTGLKLSDNILGSAVFNLDVLDTACITGQGSCLVGNSRKDYGLTTVFLTKPDKKFGLALRPRAALKVTNDGSSARLGGVFEFSKNRQSGSKFDNDRWYFFAGADAESVNYSPNGTPEFARDGFNLQNQFFIGDAKAGLGYRIGGADLSLSYKHREASSDAFNYSEDAAALSFTWKR